GPRVEDHRRGNLIDLPVAAVGPALDGIAGDVAGGEVVGGLDQPGLAADQGRRIAWLAEDRPQFELQPLQPLQESSLVVRRQEDPDLQRHYSPLVGGNFPCSCAVSKRRATTSSSRSNMSWSALRI